MPDFTTVNTNAIIAFSLLMIVFLLTYIAFGPHKKHTRSK